jgi:hypothetical protein
MPQKHSKRKNKSTGHSQEAHSQSPEVETQHAEDTVESSAQEVHEQAEHVETHTQAEEEVKVEFPYSELVRAYVPKAMDVADKVATDWKKDGSFMNLGIENPYANMAMSLGLKKAKEIEKKLDEKGVLSAVRMGVEVIKQQVNKKK